jgi:molybdopterin converting factor subunit 1
MGYGPAMRCTVRLFAQQRQIAGWRLRELDVPDGATARDAWNRLVQDVPALASGGGSVRFARNAAYVADDEPLADGDELAVIPPVAGGGGQPGQKPPIVPGSTGGHLRRFEIRPEPFSEAMLAELRATVPTTGDGALVLFVGQTRESPGTPAPGQESEAARYAGESVQGLEYEAFERMALIVLGQVADEIEQRFGVNGLSFLHRTGEVPLGESSVVIAEAASHRAAAFDACR